MTPYPPKYNWIVESEAIANLWQYQIEKSPQPDKCHNCYPLFMPNPAKLQFDANLNTSVMVYDKVTKKLVMVVLHNFTGNDDLLSYLGEVVKTNLEHCKNMQVCIMFNAFIHHIHFTTPSLPILAKSFN